MKRTEYRLKQALERIDFEIDVLQPLKDELERALARGEYPDFEVDA